MFKKIMLIAVLVLVIAALSVAALWDAFYKDPKYQKQSFSEEQKKAIEEACARQGLAPVNWEAKNFEPGAVRYYGTYEGYDVFLLVSYFEGLWGSSYLEIGPYSFDLPHEECKIYAHKNGEIEEVKQLFSEGVFNKKVIKRIAIQHGLYDNDPLGPGGYAPI